MYIIELLYFYIKVKDSIKLYSVLPDRAKELLLLPIGILFFNGSRYSRHSTVQ